MAKSQPVRKKLIRYSRVSSLKQSLYRQEALLDKFVKENPEYAEYEEDTELRLVDDGKSGHHKTRNNVTVGNLGLFMRNLENPEWRRDRVPEGSVLLIDAVDRISRQDIMTAMGTWSAIIRQGVTIVMATNPKQPVNADNINDLNVVLPLIISMATAYEESVKKAERTRQNWNNKIRDYQPGQLLTRVCPAHLKMVVSKEEKVGEPPRIRCWGCFEPANAKVPATITKIYEMVAKGATQQHILKTLNADPEQFPPWTSTGRFTQTYLSKIVGEPSLTGTLNIGGRAIPDYYPRMVKQDLWDRVCAATRHKKRLVVGERKNINVFRGLVRSTNDGGGMLLHTTTNKRKSGRVAVRRVLKSSKAIDRARDACGITVDYERFERLVLNSFITLVPQQSVEPMLERRDIAADKANRLAEVIAETDSKPVRTRLGVEMAEVYEEIQRIDEAVSAMPDLRGKRAIKTLYQEVEQQDLNSKWNICMRLRGLVSRITVTLEKFRNNTTGCVGTIHGTDGSITRFQCFNAAATIPHIADAVAPGCLSFAVFGKGGAPICHFDATAGWAEGQATATRHKTGVIRDFTNAKTIPIRDPHGFAEKMKKVFSLEHSRKKYGAADDPRKIAKKILLSSGVMKQKGEEDE